MQTAFLETTSLIRMDTGHSARVFPPEPFLHGPHDTLSWRGSRRGSPSFSCLSPQNNTWSSNFPRMAHLLVRLRVIPAGASGGRI